MQCWEADKIENQKIKSYSNVKKLSGGGINGRRLANSFREGERRLQSSTFEFNCLLSEVDMSGTQVITINYERCQISSDTFEIGQTQSKGVGTTIFSSSMQTATVILPSPIQDTLTTVVRDCDAEWILQGHSNILVYASEVSLM